MRTATATIHTGSEDSFVDVIFEYEYVRVGKMFIINYVQLLMKVYGNPGDIDTDIQCAICFDLDLIAKDNWPRTDLIDMQCEVKKVEVYYHSKLKTA